MSARAALDAARAVFHSESDPPGAAARGLAMWRNAEIVLQATLSRPELTGQALIGEARRVDILTLDDAHALVALQGWADRLRDDADAQLPSAPTEAERRVSGNGLAALEHAVNLATRLERDAATGATVGASATAQASRAPAPALTMPPMRSIAPPARRWYASAWVRVVVVLMLVAGAFGTWWMQTQVNKDFEHGVTAYERRALSRAQIAFERAATADPRDARPLIYLGRIARDLSDLPRARQWLDSAVRVSPDNSAAQRELAGALLVEGKFELARRFYVRALELDPSDRLAQGFLACTLSRLGRAAESARWADRAGPGDWTPCLERSRGAESPRAAVPLSPMPK